VEEPALRATISRNTSGFIDTVTVDATGNIIFEPVFTERGATTALRLQAIETRDGVTSIKFLRDKFFQPLVLFAVTADDLNYSGSIVPDAFGHQTLDVTSGSAACALAPTDPFGFPTANDPSCAAGQFYMVREIWSCSEVVTAFGNEFQCRVNFVRVSDTPVAVQNTSGAAFNIASLIKSFVEGVNINVANMERWVVGWHDGPMQTAPLFSLASNGAGVAPTATEVVLGEGAEPTVNHWYIQQMDACGPAGCTTFGYGFVNASTGLLLDDTHSTLGVVGVDAFDPATLGTDKVVCDYLQASEFHTPHPNETALFNILNGAGKCAFLETTPGVVVDPFAPEPVLADGFIWHWEIQGLVWAPVEVTGEFGETFEQWVPIPKARRISEAQFLALAQGTNVTAFGEVQPLADAVVREDIFTGPFGNPGWSEALAPFFLDANANDVWDAGELTFDADYDIGHRIWEYACSAIQDPNSGFFDYGLCDEFGNPAFAALLEDAKSKIRFNLNGFAFGDAVTPTKLMGAAFDFQGGPLSITAQTQFTALQVFANLFLFFEDEGGVTLNGVTVNQFGGGTATRNLRVIPSFFLGEPDFNEVISNGMCTFNIPGVGDESAGCPFPGPF
jgi:hypothetical protein